MSAIEGIKMGKKNTSQMQRKRRNRNRLLLICIIAAAIAVIGFFWIRHRHFNSYKVITSITQEDTLSTNYEQLGDYLLKYTADGASLLGSEGKSLWNQSYEMSDPTADICDTTAVIYDEKGNDMIMLGQSGKLGVVSTDKPILKAKVAKQGVVAAILEDGENTWINFYSTSGNEIATGKTRVDSPGYPVDLAVSPDGLLIMVSYMYVENGKTTSYVAFYNFGDAGQNQMDNMVSGYTYEDTVVPQVQYLAEGVSVSFGDQGFVIYKGKQIPKVSKTVEVDDEILSTFYDEDHVGMVFKSGDEDKQYKLVVYTTKGKLVFEKNFNIEYSDIKISGGQIIMHNDSQVCIFSMNGTEKFNGSLNEGTIHEIFKTNRNRYQIVVDSGIKTIKLS